MPDELITIEPGSRAQSQILNDNFNFLNGRINSTNSSLSSAVSTLETAISDAETNAGKDTTNKINSALAKCVQTTGNQTISGQKTFQNAVFVPNSSAVGTAIALAGIKKASSGFIKLGNGVIIQWGASLTASSTNPKVTFPTAFSSTNYFAMAYGRGTTHWDHTWGFKNDTQKTYCKFYIDNGDAFQWIAIGY